MLAYHLDDLTITVLASDLPERHFSSMLELTGKKPDLFHGKGGIYLSPLVRGETKGEKRKRDLVRKFNELKTEIRVPTFIYLIQRL